MDEEAYLVEEPLTAAVNVALAKARAAAASEAEGTRIVVAADTLVVAAARILGKPTDAEVARTMLMKLSGGVHHVLTGVALLRGDVAWAGVVDTRVRMRAYVEAEVEAYIARGEAFDKAGGYAIQDAAFRPVERIQGCYLNVVGLPLCAVSAGLAAVGVAGVAAAGPPERCAYCARGAPLVRS